MEKESFPPYLPYIKRRILSNKDLISISLLNPHQIWKEVFLNFYPTISYICEHCMKIRFDSAAVSFSAQGVFCPRSVPRTLNLSASLCRYLLYSQTVHRLYRLFPGSTQLRLHAVSLSQHGLPSSHAVWRWTDIKSW